MTLHPLLLGVTFLCFAGCSRPVPQPAAPGQMPFEAVDLSTFFTNMEGTFVLLDAQAGRLRVYNPERAQERFLPASTFKIPNTLIALETGVADGPGFALAWDSIAAPPGPYWPQSWKQDQTLESALRNSVYWYYQEIARRIGPDRMAAYLAQFDYGNRSQEGGVDQFWLNGGLRISPFEQVAFLRRFYEGRLGVSARTTRLARAMLVLEETETYRLSGKTGTAEVTPTRELGWLVGYLEHDGAVSYYALNMEGETVWEDWPPQQRSALVKQLLQALGALPGAQPLPGG